LRRYQELINKYSVLADKYSSKDSIGFIFIRQACLFALEEIIQSDIEVLPEFSMQSTEVWESILKYLLSVNTEITKIKEENPDQPIDFEMLNPKMIPLNELLLISDPFYTVYRGLRLFQHLAQHELLGAIFLEYFEQTYGGVTYDRYLFEICRMLIANNHDNTVFNFVYNLENEEFIHLFESLSRRTENVQIYKLLSIKKNPFFKAKEDRFFVLDNAILAEKAYSQFINDFWFDKVKHVINDQGKTLFNMQAYKSIIGYFFESYVDEKLRFSFEKAKYYAIKTFGELLIQTQAGSIEIADFYIRKNKKVIIGQVKSSSIYDEERYSGDVDVLYKNNRNAFFKNFGVDQLVSSIKSLDITIPIIDDKFPVNRIYNVFPVIVFSERAIQTPLMAKIFQDRFNELIADYDNKKVHIYPLSLIHISDLESIEEYLHHDHEKIWSIFDKHFSDPKFMPPFYHTISRYVPHNTYKKVKTSLNEDLFSKFME
jgi:hypothetical protein